MGHFGDLMFEDFGTHLPWLCACVAKTEGPVLELGAGDYSTYTLHVLCHALGRHLTTIERQGDWLARYKALADLGHTLQAVTDYLTLPVDGYGLVFIDNGPAKVRGELLRAFRGHTDIIVCHDSEDRHCAYSPTINEFKYRADCYRLRPATTAVSDNTDLSFLDLPGDMYVKDS